MKDFGDISLHERRVDLYDDLGGFFDKECTDCTGFGKYVGHKISGLQSNVKAILDLIDVVWCVLGLKQTVSD